MLWAQIVLLVLLVIAGVLHIVHWNEPLSDDTGSENFPWLLLTMILYVCAGAFDKIF